MVEDQRAKTTAACVVGARPVRNTPRASVPYPFTRLSRVIPREPTHNIPTPSAPPPRPLLRPAPSLDPAISDLALGTPMQPVPVGALVNNDYFGTPNWNSPASKGQPEAVFPTPDNKLDSEALDTAKPDETRAEAADPVTPPERIHHTSLRAEEGDSPADSVGPVTSSPSAEPSRAVPEFSDKLLAAVYGGIPYTTADGKALPISDSPSGSVVPPGLPQIWH